MICICSICPYSTCPGRPDANHRMTIVLAALGVANSKVLKTETGVAEG